MNHSRWIAYTIGAIMLMELIDGSALNTALPQIANSLQANAITVKMAITVYLLTLGLFIPASTWLADRLGNKRVLMFSISGFLFSSAACGFSTNLAELVIFRAFQGLFGAFTMPVARLAMIRLFQGNILAAMAVIAAVLTVGPMIGPLFGGVITTYVGWRVIFFINIPVGIVAMTCIYYLLPEIPVPGRQYKFDLPGFLLIGSALALLMAVVDLAVDPHIAWEWKAGGLITAVMLGISYLPYARYKQEEALIDLSVFKNACFRYFLVISGGLRLTVMGMMFVFPFYLQTKQGYSAFEAGLIQMAFVIPAWMVKKAVGSIIRHLHYYRFLVLNFSMMFSIFIANALLFMYFSLPLFMLSIFCLGLCFGSFTIITNAGIYNAIDDETQTGPANVVNSTIIQLSGAFAIAWVGLVLAEVSGVAAPNWHSVITRHAFAASQLCYAAGMGLLLCYVVLARPASLEAMPTS